MGKYDANTVEDDSSPGVAIPNTLVLNWGNEELPLCKCGCLEPRIGDFKQGHDARLKGKLNRAHTRGQKLRILEGDDVRDCAPMDYAIDRGWERFLEKAAVTATRAADRATVRKAKQPMGASSRNTGGMELLNLLKAAAEVLKPLGFYGKSAGVKYVPITPENAQSIVDGTHPALQPGGVNPDTGLAVGMIIPMSYKGAKVKAEIMSIAGDRAEIHHGKIFRVVELASLEAAANGR